VLRRFIGLCLEMFMLLRDINTGVACMLAISVCVIVELWFWVILYMYLGCYIHCILY
jgi:hypothetical protein